MTPDPTAPRTTEVPTDEHIRGWLASELRSEDGDDIFMLHQADAIDLIAWLDAQAAKGGALVEALERAAHPGCSHHPDACYCVHEVAAQAEADLAGQPVAQDEVARLLAALQRYGAHEPTCLFGSQPLFAQKPCTCGLHDLIPRDRAALSGEAEST
jgi:hypothetical protein